jgi:hypothetical protein
MNIKKKLTKKVAVAMPRPAVSAPLKGDFKL